MSMITLTGYFWYTLSIVRISTQFCEMNSPHLLKKDLYTLFVAGPECDCSGNFWLLS